MQKVEWEAFCQYGARKVIFYSFPGILKATESTVMQA